MISGRETLEDIKRTLREQRSRLLEIDRRIEAANERIIAVDAARAAQLAALARMRLGKPDGDGEPGTESGDSRVASMLAARRTSRQELEARLRDLDDTVERLEEERSSLVDAVESATQELDNAEAALQARLERDEAYRSQRQRALAAERTARYAAEKADQSEEERTEKGSAYEQDAIFMYLWRRDFGTSSYRARGLTRWLDRKVARLVGFESARSNYSRLLELPLRLREHAEAMAAAAEEEIAELRRLDEAARAADGLESLEQRRDAAAEALARHEAALAEAEAARRDAFERLERMDRGEDEAYAEMVAFLASELDRDDLRALRQAALATPFPEDDVVVARLLDLESERSRLAETVEDLEQAADGIRKRVREMEVFLRSFTERHYDRPGSGFPDEELVTTLLTQFLRGAVTSQVLWRVLDGQRSGPARRSDPTFGSGGFGRGSPWSGGTWPGSSGRGGGPFGGMGLPSSGARPSGGLTRGGFTTGGRMARGGFRTGGRKR